MLAAVPRSTRASWMRRFGARWGLRALLAVVGLGAWQIAVSVAHLGFLVLPEPASAIGDGLRQLGRSSFWSMVGITAELTIVAAVAGVLVGGVAGIALWKAGNVGRGIESVLVAWYATPTIIFYPIVLVLLGLNSWPIIVIGIPIAAVPSALGMLHALRATGPRFERISRSLCLGGFTKYRKVVLPAALPVALPQIRVAILFCALGVIAVQFVDGSSGIGYGISQAYQRFDATAMWGLVLDTLAGMVILNALLTALFRRRAEVGRAPREGRPARRDRVVRHTALGATVLAAIGLWALLSLTTSTIASPAAAVSQLADKAGASLGTAVLSTVEALAVGFALAVIFGTVVGYIMGRSHVLQDAYGSLLAACFTVPTVVIYPLFLGIFGVGETAKFVIAGISAFFPIAIITSESIANVDPVLSKVAESLHCSRWQAARKVIVPAVLPQVLGGIRIGFGVAFIAVVVSEMFTSNYGLGVQALTYYNQQEYGAMYGMIVLIIAIALIGTGLLVGLEGRLERRYE
jgi:NitT/TauT family transport system permease protein